MKYKRRLFVPWKYRKMPLTIHTFRYQMDSYMPDWFTCKVVNNEVILHTDGTISIKDGWSILNKLQFSTEVVNTSIENLITIKKGDFIFINKDGNLDWFDSRVFGMVYKVEQPIDDPSEY